NKVWELLAAMLSAEADQRPTAGEARLRLAGLGPRLTLLEQTTPSPAITVACPTDVNERAVTEVSHVAAPDGAEDAAVHDDAAVVVAPAAIVEQVVDEPGVPEPAVMDEQGSTDPVPAEIPLEA